MFFYFSIFLKIFIFSSQEEFCIKFDFIPKREVSDFLNGTSLDQRLEVGFETKRAK